MADQRLEVLMKNTEPQYVSGSPLLLEAIALYLDKTTNNCVVQLKWKNIDSKPIKAVMIEIDGYNSFSQKLEPVQYQYDGLLVTQGSEFGGKTPIMIKNNKAIKCDIILKAVSFSDDTIWRSEAETALEPLPGSKPQTLSGETLDQLIRDLTKQGNKSAATYSPQMIKGLWQCGCGSWQYADTPCLKCKITQKALSDISDESALAQNLAKYKDEQEKIRIESEKKAEEARIAREKADAERKEKEEAERVRREKLRKEEEAKALVAKKKKKKIGIILTAVLVVAAGAVYAITQIVIPGNQYSKAETAFQNKQYIEAYEIFSQAGNFKDSQEQAKKAAYAQAEIFLQQDDYDQAYTYFQLAQDYSDAAEQSNNAALLNAKKYQAQFDYENATAWYQKANNYERAAATANIQYAVGSERTWLHTDTREEKPVTLPENIFLFVTTSSSSKYSTTKEYGVLKTGEDGWITSRHDYSTVTYYPDYDLILALTDSMCTIIDLKDNSFHDVQNVAGIRNVSDDGIVGFRGVGGKYSWDNNGFFNRKGEIVLPAEYESLGSFSQGLTPVSKNGLYGYINTKGETVIDFQYTAAEPFRYGYAKVKMDEHKVKEGDMYVTYNKGWGLIDLQGNHVIEPNWYDLEIGYEYSGTYSDTYGDEFISEGFVRVQKSYGKYGLLDLNNKVILEPKYDTIGYPRDGLIYVSILKEGEKYYPSTTAGWVDYTGKMVLNLISHGIDGPDRVGSFNNGIASLTIWKKGGWIRDLVDVLINRNGQILWEEPDNDWSANMDSNGYVRISSYKSENKGKEEYYRAENGSLIRISEAEYEAGREVFTWEWDEDLYGINTNPNNVDLSTPFYKQWSNVGAFTPEGIAKVSLNENGPYGFVTEQSTVLVDAIYEDALDYYNGFAAVKHNGKWGYIDAAGKTVFEPQYQSASSVSDAKTIYVQNENGTYSLLSIDGQVLLAGIQAVDGADGNPDGGLPTPSNNVFVRLENQNNWMQVDATGKQLF